MRLNMGETLESDIFCFIKYMYGELEIYKEFERDNLVTCTECCECDRCVATKEWLDLPWYRKFLAKMFL